MKLGQIGEFGLIDRLKEKVSRPNQTVVVGLGDDAAALRVSPNGLLLLTADVLVERVHFNRRIHSFWQIGWRALVANVSDIAAMGGLPRHALVSICLPKTVSVEQVDELYDGMRAVADEYDFQIIGGDTVSSPRDLVVSISLSGEVEEQDLVTRGGAQVGDLICVTGDLGASQAGFSILRRAISPPKGRKVPLTESEWSAVRDRHLRPRPRLQEARVLAQGRLAHAMIDISDGLAGDVGHIARESRVGVEILEEKIPVGAQTSGVAKHLKKTSLDYALYGGEDFELLFTLSPADAGRAAEKVLEATGTAVSVIGKIIPVQEGYVLVSPRGERSLLKTEGYRHF